MGLNFSRCAVLAGVLLGVALAAQAQSDVKPLTEQELIKQIESLDPAKNDPLQAAPASVGPTPNASGSRAITAVRDQSPNATPKPGSSPTMKMRASTPPPAGATPTASTDKPDKKEKGPTEIVALAATFDQKAHLAVFIGEVVVTDPEFNVQCDRLTAYLKQDQKTAAAPGASPTPHATPTPHPTPATPAPTDKPEAKKGGAGGLEKAIADADPGRIVVIHQDKKEADGSTSQSIGKGKKATYNTKAGDSFSTPDGRPYITKEGDIVLQGSPEVQQKINTCVSTDEATVMVLNRNGEMKVFGPHKTTIRDQTDLTQ